MPYGALRDASGRVAWMLRERGLGRGDFVGVVMERGPGLAVALLGILKAGAAYVPLDPDYPSERLRGMLEDSGVCCVLTQRNVLVRLEAGGVPGGDAVNWVCVEDLGVGDPVLEGVVGGEGGDPAYMIYTSGSTGRPKGVVISQAAAAHSLAWLTSTFPMQPGEGVLQKAPISFDFSVWELFFPLLSGGRLVFAEPGGQQDPVALAELMRRESVAWAFFVPSMLARFLDAVPEWKGLALKHVFCSGEPLPAELAARFFAKSPAHLHNVYGPAEAAVEVTHWECRRDWEPGRPVPIGAAFPGLQLKLLDEQMVEVPEGETGEICLAGTQLANGYHRRPDLTEMAFVRDAAGVRWYRTGDLGKRTTDGTWLCLGRRDQQVKVRGFRIELGEVEWALERHPGIRRCVAGLRDSAVGEPVLCAWLLAEGEAVAVPVLREFLLRSLPEFMVPARFVWVDSFPLSPNGKLDRAALPDPGSGRPLPEETYRAPGSAIERLVAEVWGEVLGLDRVGIDDPFFELGGDSLSLVRMHGVLAEHGIDGLEVAELFEFGTIRALALRLESRTKGPNPQADDRAARQRQARSQRRELAGRQP